MEPIIHEGTEESSIKITPLKTSNSDLLESDYAVEIENINEVQTRDSDIPPPSNVESYDNDTPSPIEDGLNEIDNGPINPHMSIQEFYLSRDYTKEGFCIFVVDNPLKKTSMLKTKVTYRIFCHTTLDMYPETEFEVRRSFSDTKWLRSYLRWKYPYCIIPPLTNTKTITQKASSSSLINLRRRSIQRFLNRVGSHKILAESKALLLFLSGDEETFKEIKKFYKEKMKKKKEKRIPTKSYGSIFSHNPPDISSQDGELLRKMKVYRKEISELRQHYKSLHKAAESVVEGRKSNTSSLKSFTKQFAKFNTSTQLRYPSSKFDTKSLIDTLIIFQNTFDKIKSDEIKLMEFDSEGLHEIIKDWTKYMDECTDLTERYEKFRIKYCETELTLEEAKKKEKKRELTSPRLSATEQWLENPEDHDEIKDYSDITVVDPELQERIQALTKQLEKDKEILDLFLEHFESERMWLDSFRAKEMEHWTKYYANFHIVLYKRMISHWESYLESSV